MESETATAVKTYVRRKFSALATPRSAIAAVALVCLYYGQ